MDTGYTVGDIEAVKSSVGRAGLEQPVTKEAMAALPTVIKSPHAVDVLPQMLEEKWIDIELAIIPVRNLYSAAQSRRDVSKRGRKAGYRFGGAPGGLWKTRSPRKQEQVLAQQFYNTVEPLIASEIPTIFLSFPRYVDDIEYFDRVLSNDLSLRFGVDRTDLLEAHRIECNPTFVSVR